MKPFDHLTFAETTHDGEGALHYGGSRGGDGAAGAPAPTGGRAPADGRGDEGEGGRRHSSLQAQLNNLPCRAERGFWLRNVSRNSRYLSYG